MELKIKNSVFTLLPQKAVWWEAEGTLLVSDLHIGKITHFRNAGVALPHEAAEENFLRLDEIMKFYPVQRIIFIGDLFHSHMNDEWKRFCIWRNQYPEVAMSLVLGNHDLMPRGYYSEICLSVYEEELIAGGFTFAHHPKKHPEPDEYVISGHIHPIVKLSGKGRQQLRLPCFWFGQQQAVLPSFGTFTGGYVIDVTEGDQVVAIVEEKLIKIK